jgi:hypothetical protein
MVLSNGFNDMNSPGVLAVVATQDNTQVTVNSRPISQPVPASARFTGRHHAVRAQQRRRAATGHQKTTSPTMAAHTATAPKKPVRTPMATTNCNPGTTYDLTGSMITASQPVRYGRPQLHICSLQLLGMRSSGRNDVPLQTWGKHFMVGLTHPVRPSTNETNVIRILSGDNDVQVTFNPAVQNPATLNAGEYIEFLATPGQHFKVNAQAPLWWANSRWARTTGQIPTTKWATQRLAGGAGGAVPLGVHILHASVDDCELRQRDCQDPADTMEFITLDGMALHG